MRNDCTTNDQINLNVNLLDFFSEDKALQKERLWRQFYQLIQNNFECKNINGYTLKLSISFKEVKEGVKIKIGEMYQFVNYNEIVRVQANSNYTLFYTIFSSKPLITSKTLKFYTENLLKHNFVKLHRAHIVNPLFIKNYCSDTNELHLTNGCIIKVARRRKKILENYYQIMH